MTTHFGKGKSFPSWWKKIDNYCWTHNIPISCKNHISVSKDKKEIYFEPYDAHLIEIKSLIELCNKYNLDFRITGRSTYHPHTFLITITQNEGAKKRENKQSNTM